MIHFYTYVLGLDEANLATTQEAAPLATAYLEKPLSNSLLQYIE